MIFHLIFHLPANIHCIPLLCLHPIPLEFPHLPVASESPFLRLPTRLNLLPNRGYRFSLTVPGLRALQGAVHWEALLLQRSVGAAWRDWWSLEVWKFGEIPIGRVNPLKSTLKSIEINYEVPGDFSGLTIPMGVSHGFHMDFTWWKHDGSMGIESWLLAYCWLSWGTSVS